MDIDTILNVLVGIIIGVLIGYAGANMIQPYVEPYMFQTTLTLTVQTPSNITSISLNSTVVLSAVLNVTLPSELSAISDTVKPYLQQNKYIELLGKKDTDSYWSIWSTQQTTSYGECSFNIQFDTTGTYQFKVVFHGTQLLKSSESQIIILNVT